MGIIQERVHDAFIELRKGNFDEFLFQIQNASKSGFSWHLQIVKKAIHDELNKFEEDNYEIIIRRTENEINKTKIKKDRKT